MENPKIVIIPRGSVITREGDTRTYGMKKTAMFEVIAETDTHYFFVDGGERYSIWKKYIKKVRLKDSRIPFSDMKKEEIIHTIDAFSKIVKRAQEISAIISRHDITSHNMLIYKLEELICYREGSNFILENHSFINDEIVLHSCKVPMKYIWDHSWKKNISKDFGEKQ